jgi:hypothetical protein
MYYATQKLRINYRLMSDLFYLIKILSYRFNHKQYDDKLFMYFNSIFLIV